MRQKILQCVAWASSLKNNRKSLVILIAINVFMAIVSNIVDWDWLMGVSWYLRPFTPICSLYPLTLFIWYTLYFFKKKIPNWYTHFVFMGIVGYGIMAYIYYPVSMSQWGLEWRLLGNMLWVTTYALQSFVIASELKKIPFYQYLLVAGYFVFKDYADRFLGTFIDTTSSDYPEFLKNFFGLAIITIHAGVFVGTRKIDSIKAFFVSRFAPSEKKKIYSEATSVSS